MKAQEIVKQLKILGIECQENTWLTAGTFPGCTIQEGTLLYNPNRETVEALLHEAGHIAVCPTRKFLSGWNINQDSNENAAIAWSYCAASKLGISLEEVFGVQFREIERMELPTQFKNKDHPGINLLIKLGMLATVEDFPNLIKWLVEQDAS